ncbi:hypothetical protein [Celeribacter sp. ULVN23_4]
MSDPMTNIDADDVLASIRRLVAETHGQRAETPVPSEETSLDSPADAADAASAVALDEGQKQSDMAESDSSPKAEAPPQIEALVLTPAFRVAQPAAEEETEVSAEAAPEPLILSPELAVPVSEPVVNTVFKPVSELEEALDEAALERAPEAPTLEVDDVRAEPEAAEFEAAELETDAPTVEARLETLISDEVQSAATDHAEAVVEDAMKADWAASFDDTPNEVAAEHASRLTLEERIAELEAAVGAQAAEWEPDGSEEMDVEIPHEMPRAFTEAGARVLHFRSRSTPRDEDQTAMSDSDKAQPVSEEINEAEVVEDALSSEAEMMSPAVEDVEAFEEVSFEHTPFRHSVADSAEAPAEESSVDEAEVSEVSAEDEPTETDAPEAIADDLPETEEGAEEFAAFKDAEDEEGVAADVDPSLEEELALAGYSDEDIMDEDALRDLVAQVIREELQGELGQRITRNVRRLVRREVQQALSLRDFE